MKYDVFISYSTHDQKIVEGLCAYLESCGIRCFVAYRDIPSGKVWAGAIVDALDQSRMMVVVFSDNFNHSEQVDREIELASMDKKNILTFRISDAAFLGAKRYYLQNLHWIDAFPDPKSTFGSLANAVAALLGIPLEKVNNTAPCNADMPTREEDDGSPAEVVCSHVEAAEEASWKVGEYYVANGIEGVVFEVSEDGQHGKIVALKQSVRFLKWASNMKDSAQLIGAQDKSDGMKNLRAIQLVENWRQKYPAFAWCADQGDGYYLPSLNELQTLLLNADVKNAVNQTLRDRQADVISDLHYWTSTECEEKLHGEYCAYFIDAYSGFTYHYRKYRTNYVRAIAAF